MSLKLVLLGLLFDKEMYGYEIHQVISQKHRHFMRVAFSSIYYNLDKLEKTGLIRKETVTQDSRPDRNIYTITPEGREKFRRLLTKNIEKEGERIHECDPFNVSVSLMRHLPREKVKEVFRKRLETVKGHNEHYKEMYQMMLKSYEVETTHHIDFYILVLLKRGIVHSESELEWVRQTLDMLESDLYKEVPIAGSLDIIKEEDGNTGD